VLSAPVLGAVYVVGLALEAAHRQAIDERTVGTQAKQIAALVEGRFGGEVARLGVAIGAAAVLVGALLGVVAWGLAELRDRAFPRNAPRTLLGRTARALALVVALHAALELWAMARYPQLYADAWYARGGWLRTVQVLATDVFGPAGVAAFTLYACAAFLAGPPSRWREWPRRVRILLGIARPHSRAALAGTAALGALALVLALPFRLAPAHAAPRSRPGSGEAGDLPSNESRPNVVILAADSLRADRLDPRTAPHLSALADRGTRFDRAYVSLPRTFPSWVSFLTGRHPHHHGIRSMFPRWEERARDFDALPERMARAGWATGVVSDYAGDIFSRIDLGFGTVDVPEFDFRQLVRQHALEAQTPLLPVLHSRLGRVAFPVLREMNDAADPGLLARDAVRVMRRLEGRGPFFLVVFFSTAHFPYAAPSPYYRRFTDAAYRGRFKYHKPVGLGREEPANASDEAQVRALYDGAVAAIDDAAQSVLDAIERDGIGGRTVVVVTADHGETLYDHGHGQGHGDHLFGDEGTHVPLVVVDPRIGQGHREGAIVRDIDLAPTLYALTGVGAPGDLDGQSLAPALQGTPPAPALAYAETGLWFTETIPGLPAELRLPYPGIAHLTEVDTQHGDELVLRAAMRPLTLVAKHRMVRDERWKLVYAPTRAGVRWLLFDTQEDPGEERDVAAAHPEVVAQLQGELTAWMRNDPAMGERGGFLVPREAGGGMGKKGDEGLVRIEEEGGGR
jgi:arylsulfatase A-like enzyme